MPAKNVNTDLPPIGFSILLLLGSRYDGAGIVSAYCQWIGAQQNNPKLKPTQTPQPPPPNTQINTLPQNKKNHKPTLPNKNPNEIHQ